MTTALVRGLLFGGSGLVVSLTFLVVWQVLVGAPAG